MKKPHKSRHNPLPPPWSKPRPVKIGEAYQREIDRSTEKLERQYSQAQKRAEQAKRRLERAERAVDATQRKRQIMQLRAQWEIREAELEEIRRLMNHPTATRGVMHRSGRDERLEMGTGVRRRAG